MTVLRHATIHLVKRWNPDGTIDPYGQAKYFTVTSEPVDSFSDLVSALLRREDDPYSAVIRGTYPADSGEHVQRTTLNFEDRPLHWILIEVDQYEPLCADPVTDPAVCVAEYVSTLPACFHHASYHWQLSNSAGHPKHAGTLKAHLWFWLETPYTSVELRTWAKAESVPCDAAVFNLVQLHYTGAPMFASGVVDPVSVRSGTVMGHRLGVDLMIDPAVLETARASVRGPRPALLGGVSPDPVAAFLTRTGQVLGKNHDGDLCVRCPLQDLHGQGTEGDTSTVWLIAGGANYEQGHFKCSHTTHCSALGDPEFLEACGYLESFTEGFEVLPPLMVNGFNHATGLHEIMPSPGAPNYIRKAGAEKGELGEIKNCFTNIVLAMRRPDLTHYHLRFDAFHGQMIVQKPGVASGSLTCGIFDDHLDVSALRLKLPELGLPHTIKKEDIYDAALAVASEPGRLHDSMIEWVHSLPPWDGTPRWPTFYHHYLGAADTPYSTAVGVYTGSALVGRATTPGCQADMAPIWFSAQGSGKSSAIRALAPTIEHFVELSMSDHDKDFSRRIRGKVVGEFAELKGLHTSALESVKVLMTRRREEFRDLWSKKMTTYDRRLLIIGTSNDRHVFADETGNRRWLPIEVGTVQDVAAIEHDRSQLWAEGLVLFRQHGVMWQEAQRLATVEHANCMTHLMWETPISEWIDRLPLTSHPDGHDQRIQIGELGYMEFGQSTADFIRISDVAQYALNMQIAHAKTPETKNITAVLQRLGWEPEHFKLVKIDGKQKTLRGWGIKAS